ncbi:50S ribosomal protein L21 [Candidatus Nomurabacteria bacterium]|nr:50S ribosomal protein L21 [Candidatus Nomurabacteria bacterium]
MATATKTTKKTSKAKSDGFAVIKTGGKQYRVSVGDSIKIEKMKGEYKKGDKVTFSEVLLTDDGKNTVIGTPFIDGAKVEGTIDVIGRAPKVLVIKYKQKSRYMKKNGHRQPYFKVVINSI